MVSMSATRGASASRRDDAPGFREHGLGPDKAAAVPPGLQGRWNGAAGDQPDPRARSKSVRSPFWLHAARGRVSRGGRGASDTRHRVPDPPTLRRSHAEGAGEVWAVTEAESERCR